MPNKMHKLLSTIGEWLAKHTVGRWNASENEHQDEPLDLSEYGTPFEDLPIEPLHADLKG